LFKALKIVDTPDWRKKNYDSIPLGGGFLMLTVLILNHIIASTIFSIPLISSQLLILFAAIMIFVLGTIDDLFILRASVKFSVQIFIAAFVLTDSDLLLTNAYGLFGIFQMTPLFSWVVSMLFLLVFMNMFNLIDGIDGLASGVGLVSLVFLSATFSMAESSSLIAFSSGLLGILLVIFCKNYMPGKMYLGDSGALTLGFIVGILTLKNLSISNITFPIVNYIEYGPVYACVLFWYPLMDLVRVFILRIYRRRSPFSPDREHFHLRMVDKGYSHFITAFVIIMMTLCFELLAYCLSRFMGVNVLFFSMFFLASILSHLVFLKTYNE
jgi:UDP-GlcNAc:undecaprenyl-phosphate/decaprenyl-phosphate GlcNAc-1-phosphate transferase